jgi:D-methionine transport system substrate-binding protein
MGKGVKRMRKRSIILLLAIAFVLIGAISGCSTDGGSDNGEATTLKIGATPVPHSEILEFVKPMLAEEGVELEIVEFTDYVQPNLALDNEELDANFFQHVPYLEDFNEKNDTALSAVILVHFEPLGIYPGQSSSIEELQEGDKVAVPNDTTNEARALLLLQEAGLIEIDENAGLEATIKDITSNPKNLEIIELEAAQISRSLPDVDLGVINGNYAIEAGLNAGEDALMAEDKESLAAQTFANVVVIRTGDDREMFETLKNVLQSEEVKNFLEEKYQGAVVPVF